MVLTEQSHEIYDLEFFVKHFPRLCFTLLSVFADWHRIRRVLLTPLSKKHFGEVTSIFKTFIWKVLSNNIYSWLAFDLIVLLNTMRCFKILRKKWLGGLGRDACWKTWVRDLARPSLQGVWYLLYMHYIVEISGHQHGRWSAATRGRCSWQPGRPKVDKICFTHSINLMM
jgi:hypothetical protein